MERISEIKQLPLHWRYVTGKARQWCEFDIESSPRVLLAAIDRMATRSNYSVWDEMTGLRVQTTFARIRIKNHDNELMVRTEPCLPKLWLVFPAVIVLTSILIGSYWSFGIGLPLALFAYQTLERISTQKAVGDIEKFKEQLADVIQSETGASVYVHTAEQG